MNEPTNQPAPPTQGGSLKWLLIILAIVIIVAICIWVFYIK